MKCEEEPSNVLLLLMGKAMDEVEDDVMVKVWVTSGYYIGEMYMRILKPLMHTAAKSSLTILMKSCRQSINRKIFDRVMLIRTLPTTFLKIFCKFLLNSEDIL